jgi:hypothetical protein
VNVELNSLWFDERLNEDYYEWKAIEDFFFPIGFRLMFHSSTSSSSLSFLADKFPPVGLTDSNILSANRSDYVEVLGD